MKKTWPIVFKERRAIMNFAFFLLHQFDIGAEFAVFAVEEETRAHTHALEISVCLFIYPSIYPSVCLLF